MEINDELYEAAGLHECVLGVGEVPGHIGRGVEDYACCPYRHPDEVLMGYLLD